MNKYISKYHEIIKTLETKECSGYMFIIKMQLASELELIMDNEELNYTDFEEEQIIEYAAEFYLESEDAYDLYNIVQAFVNCIADAYSDNPSKFFKNYEKMGKYDRLNLICNYM